MHLFWCKMVRKRSSTTLFTSLINDDNAPAITLQPPSIQFVSNTFKTVSIVVEMVSNVIELPSNAIEMASNVIERLRTPLNCFRTSLRWSRTSLRWLRTPLRWSRTSLNCFRTPLRWFRTSLNGFERHWDGFERHWIAFEHHWDDFARRWIAFERRWDDIAIPRLPVSPIKDKKQKRLPQIYLRQPPLSCQYWTVLFIGWQTYWSTCTHSAPRYNNRCLNNPSPSFWNICPIENPPLHSIHCACTGRFARIWQP